MAHKDHRAREYRIWLRPDTVKQVKLLTMLMNRNDWNMVADDMIRIGVSYFNRVAKMELTDWDGSMDLLDLDGDIGLSTLRGELPPPEDRLARR
jgi:hypothetical protein